jgi:hypothetical protein
MPPISLLTAPVAPEPAKMTTVESSPPIARDIASRASSRNMVVRSPVSEDSVCVLPYQGSTSCRMKSSMKLNDRPDAV